jgi:hypothetical protein
LAVNPLLGKLQPTQIPARRALARPYPEQSAAHVICPLRAHGGPHVGGHSLSGTVAAQGCVDPALHAVERGHDAELESFCPTHDPAEQT